MKSLLRPEQPTADDSETTQAKLQRQRDLEVQRKARGGFLLDDEVGR